ncbi:MAG TPA: YjhG/YagF family D-xylonate dehydratase, partial [Anaerolineae bacterium]
MIDFESSDPNLYNISTHAPGPAGRLPLQPDWLRDTASGTVFGWTQDAAMGWNPARLGSKEFLILSTQGGIRAPDGTPIALGYHTGHWEVGLLAQAAAEELTRLGGIPFAGYVSDPC